jgi:C_GCAxxG_C_C family probable redox protein
MRHEPRPARMTPQTPANRRAEAPAWACAGRACVSGATRYRQQGLAIDAGDGQEPFRHAMTDHSTDETIETAVALAHDLFLDDANTYGCAETTLVALSTAYGLPDAHDSGPAMALNGGIAYSGAMCGAITGAALAVGRLAATRIADHAQAKRVAREVTRDLMAAFEVEFGAMSCRALTGVDLSTPEGHAAFIEGGAWRDGCLHQVEAAVARLAPLADDAAWRARLATLERDAPAERRTHRP